MIFIMKNFPKVSVIIPTYNRADLLPRALNSVLNQTFQDFELIIVEDGSTDNTKQLVEEFQKKDERIKYIWQKNSGGPAKPKNTGIKNSQGEFIAFLDDDDEWLPEKLETQLNKIEENDYDIFFSNWYLWNPETNQKNKAFNFNPLNNKKDLFKIFIKRNIGNPSTVIIKKAKLEKIGYFDEKLKPSEDYDLWLRFILNNARVGFSEEPLYLYRQHIKQMSSNQYIMRTSRLKVFYKIIKKHPGYLIKYPILTKKIFLLQSYKLFYDFLKLFKNK